MTLSLRPLPHHRKPLSLLLALAATAALARDHTYLETLRGNLRDGYYRTHTVTLYAGYTYYFLGTCDSDCYDLDLKLKNRAGRTLAQDTADDDEPVIVYRVTSTDRYNLEVHMADCTANPCEYEVEIHAE